MQLNLIALFVLIVLAVVFAAVDCTKCKDDDKKCKSCCKKLIEKRGRPSDLITGRSELPIGVSRFASKQARICVCYLSEEAAHSGSGGYILDD
jgi:hypothetical protein